MSQATRHDLTPEQRSLQLELVLDPIFVNMRKIETVFGQRAMKMVDFLAEQIPSQTPQWMRKTRMFHAYSRVVLDLCNDIGVSTLGQALASPAIRRGILVCSIERLVGTEDVYEQKQGTVAWLPSVETDYQVSLHFSTSYITCDTGFLDLSRESEIGLVAQVESIAGTSVQLRPLLMGAPTLGLGPCRDPGFDTTWWGYDYFENFPEDIDEFARMKDVPMQVDWSTMQLIPEAAVKACLCEILGQAPRKDWSGEQSDLFTSALHLAGRRTTGAFLLKGPARFAPLTPAHLGKNGDQIVRLANEPAELLVVQHCHQVEPSVRATLRAFAVQPGRPRRFCVIDGRDTLRILQAYGLLEKALAWKGVENEKPGQ